MGSCHGNYRNAQMVFQLLCIDGNSLFFSQVHHIQGQDHWIFHFEKLNSQFQATSENGSIHYVDDQVRFLSKQVGQHDLFSFIRRIQGIGSGKIDNIQDCSRDIDSAVRMGDRCPGKIGSFTF